MTSNTNVLIENKRQFWLDLARTLAIISISCNHALSRSLSSYAALSEMPFMNSFIRAALWIFSRVGVPLFLMISGALLLGRDYEDKAVQNRFYRNNWWGLFRTTEIWLVIMFCYLQLSGSSILRNEGIGKAIINLLSTVLFINQTTMGSMWYMSMILCVYLMIPVIAIGLRKIGDSLFMLLCGIAVISGMLIPNLNTLLSSLNCHITIRFAISITDVFSIYFTYILVGYWINQGKLDKMEDKYLYVAFMISFIFTTLFQYWLYFSPIVYQVRYADIGILISSAFLFEIIKRKAHLVQKLEKQITYISRISFGIYFLHICIMTGMLPMFRYFSNLGMFMKFLILEIGAFLLSVLVIHLLSRNGLMKKYLFLIKD